MLRAGEVAGMLDVTVCLLGVTNVASEDLLGIKKGREKEFKKGFMKGNGRRLK